MAKLYDLARMTTATAGTGTITLGVAASGFLTFAQAGVADGDTVAYGIADGANSEVGTGTYAASAGTLTRTVTRSTNGNAAISLSGSAQVFIVARKEDLLSVSETQSANAVFAGPGSGSAAAPGFRALVDADLPAGHWVLLNTLTASSSASLSDTTSFTSTYTDYLIVLENLLPGTNAVSMLFQVNSGGVQTSSYASSVFTTTSTAGSGATSSTSGVLLDFNAMSNTGAGLSGEVSVFNALSTSAPKQCLMRSTSLRSDGIYGFDFGGGVWTGGNGALAGFQISCTSGVIASGKAKVYGRK